MQDRLVPRRELSRRLSEEVLLGCGAQGWAGSGRRAGCTRVHSLGLTNMVRFAGRLRSDYPAL